MTKVTILEKTEPVQPKKKIEFVQYLDSDGFTFKKTVPTQAPAAWREILLLCKDYGHRGLDLMFAVDPSNGDKCLFLGHFNDGVV